MQRGWWLGCGALALLFGVAQASVDVVSEARFEPLEYELDQADAGAPRFELQIGRSPTQIGFALDIAGGTPFGWALLSLERDGAPVERSLVALDDEGAARVMKRNYELEWGLRASCVIPQTAGNTLRTLTIPSASQISASQPSTPQFALSAGDVVITEVMKDPSFVSDTAGEWFEVRNLTNHAINLDGWTLTDAGTNQHTIHNANGVWVPARSYFVLGNNADTNTNGGVQVDYKYSNFSLGNGADDIRLTDPTGLLVDAISYDDGIFWPDAPGKSLSLDRALVDATSNDDGNNWCAGLYAVSGSNTDLASPRRANSVCP